MPRRFIYGSLKVLILVILLGFFVKEFFQPVICFKEKCIKVELARTQKQQRLGLMFRKHLDENSGMLFIFDKDDFWGIWMKNTYIPLDIIWFDRNKKVVDIVKNAMPAYRTGRPTNINNPPVFKPVFSAGYVLEVNSGFCDKNKIEPGDEIRFKWIFS